MTNKTDKSLFVEAIRYLNAHWFNGASLEDLERLEQSITRDLPEAAELTNCFQQLLSEIATAKQKFFIIDGGYRDIH